MNTTAWSLVAARPKQSGLGALGLVHAWGRYCGQPAPGRPAWLAPRHHSCCGSACSSCCLLGRQRWRPSKHLARCRPCLLGRQRRRPLLPCLLWRQRRRQLPPLLARVQPAAPAAAAACQGAAAYAWQGTSGGACCHPSYQCRPYLPECKQASRLLPLPDCDGGNARPLCLPTFVCRNFANLSRSAQGMGWRGSQAVSELRAGLGPGPVVKMQGS